MRKGRKEGRKGGRKEERKEESVEITWGELRWKERETGVPDERGWDVKRGNSLGAAPQEGARRERRTNVDGM